MRQRVVVMRLWQGGYLGTNGRPTLDSSKAVRLAPEDAYRFMALMRTRDFTDPLKGMSMEWLPKRTSLTPMSSDYFKKFVAVLATARMVAEADKQERVAEGYIVQAKCATEMAHQMRERAKEIRAKITSEQWADLIQHGT